MSAERRSWVIKQDLGADELQAYVAAEKLERGQIIALTEPEPNKFTLIYEPTSQQVQGAQAEQPRQDNEARLIEEVTEGPPVEAPRW
jgi:hypothetical protein